MKKYATFFSAVLKSIKLLLPALIPSWRFFDVIAPSPRIEYSILDSDNHIILPWQDYLPLPDRISLYEFLQSLIWNPQRNESLYLITCAESLLECSSDFREKEILSHIYNSIRCNTELNVNSYSFQFRLIVFSRLGSELQNKVLYYSKVIQKAV